MLPMEDSFLATSNPDIFLAVWIAFSQVLDMGISAENAWLGFPPLLLHAMFEVLSQEVISRAASRTLIWHLDHSHKDACH